MRSCIDERPKSFTGPSLSFGQKIEPATDKQPTQYWLSNLPASIRLRKPVAIAKLRGRIERDYEALKQVGLGPCRGSELARLSSPCNPIAVYGLERCFFPSDLAYPALNPAPRPEALLVRTERRNSHSIATLRRQIATHLARSLPRCPCCLHSNTSWPARVPVSLLAWPPCVPP